MLPRMNVDEDPQRASLHQVANLLAVIETQLAVVRSSADEHERGRRALEALQWIEQAGRDTQRLLSIWRQRLREHGN
jgi:uncharacterized membrane-anchored protein